MNKINLELLARLDVIESMTESSGVKELCEVVRQLIESSSQSKPIEGFKPESKKSGKVS